MIVIMLIMVVPLKIVIVTYDHHLWTLTIITYDHRLQLSLTIVSYYHFL
jgi:hypothetical protein